MKGSARPLADRTIVVAVGGGIAAYKAVELVRQLSTDGATVRVVMTQSARQFVGELTFQALSGQPVFSDLFDLTQESEIGHIRVADGADLVIVAPATANLLARSAAGAANDVVSAILLAARCPILVAPSMNVNMWEHPATRANVATLMARGIHVVGPGTGFLACRWTGPGRLAEPADIAEAARGLLSLSDLDRRRIVVSAGPTHEAIDPVRFLGNRSSGKMGIEIARAAAWRGAEVALVLGPSSEPVPPGVTVHRVTTAAEMATAVDGASRDCDAVIMAAAVADYRPTAPASNKIAKTNPDGAESPGFDGLTFTRNPDILAGLVTRRGEGRRPILVGFAAETHDVVARAQAKLASKGCDLIVANDVSEAGVGFAGDTNRVTFVSSDGVDSGELQSKADIAHQILDRVVALFEATTFPPATRGTS